MRPLIPFVHQLDNAEADQWCATLRELLPSCDIRLFSQLSDEAKAQVSVAVVANPDPDEVAQLSNLIWLHSVWAGVEGMMANLAHLPFDIVRLTDPHLAQAMSEAVLAWRTASVALISALEGTQPTFTQLPPIVPWPISATRLPASAAVIAAENPADPAPITARSYPPSGAQQSSFIVSSILLHSKVSPPPPYGVSSQRDEEGQGRKQHVVDPAKPD